MVNTDQQANQDQWSSTDLQQNTSDGRHGPSGPAAKRNQKH
jgi:hypothetical protein